MLFTKHKKIKKILNAELPGEKGFAEGKLNTGSLTWMFIRKWANSELHKARLKNDRISTTDVETAVLRGRIKVLKEILSLPTNSIKKEFKIPSYDDDPTFVDYTQY